MITSLASPIPSQRTGATVLAKEAVGLVSWLVQQRRRSLQLGWSRMDATTATHCCNTLQAWLSTNTCPSPATLRLFWAKHEATLRMVSLPNGAKRLDRLQRIISMI